YDVNTLALIAGRDDDIAALAREADLVVNLVSDPDQSAAMLPVAAQLIDRLGKPALNDPRAVACTTREAVAERLAGIAGARVAKVLRC
ncbi:UNVERIFIED_CONTAM: hypothetical protein NY100_24465, partial [Prevotella sp. 15_C9]